MKTTYLLLAVTLLVLTGCTTAYKTGQTPDDVYYSPARPEDETVREEHKKETRYSDEYYDDRYLRMKVRNRYRWNDLDDWYVTDRYSIGYNYYYGSFNNPFNRWNYYYNPYCCCLHNYNYAFVNPKSPAAPPVVKRPFNLLSYGNTGYNNNNNNRGMQKTSIRTTTTTGYNNSNNNNNRDGLSNKVRTIFNNDNTGSRPSRTYTPSSSGSTSNNSGSRSSSSGSTGSSSGGSGGGAVSRPTRN